MLNLNLPLRTFQALLAIATLGFNGYVTNWYLAHTKAKTAPYAPLWLLLVGAFTLLTLPYLFFNPPLQITHQNRSRNSRFFNKWAVLGLDTVSCLLWFAAFVNLAVFRSGLVLCGGYVCALMGWGAGIGAVAWVTFAITTVLAGLHVLRTRTGGPARATETQNHGTWIGMPRKAQA